MASEVLLTSGYEVIREQLSPMLPNTGGGNLASTMSVDVTFGLSSDTTKYPKSTQAKLTEFTKSVYPYSDGILLPESLNITVNNGVLVGRNTDLVLLPAFGGTEGAVVGFIDTLKKSITLTEWQVGDNKMIVNAGAVQNTKSTVSEIAFRTPVAPLKPANFQFICELENGTMLTLTFNEQGELDSRYAKGVIDYTSGFVFIAFRDAVDLTGKVKAVMYEKASTSDKDYQLKYTYWSIADEGAYYGGGKTYVKNGRLYADIPIRVKNSTMKYNTVAFTYLPVDKELIGVDTVKLPQSGLVPSYRKGDLILVKAEKSIDYPDLTASTEYSLGMTRLTLIELIDSLGAKLDYSLYDVDLDAGKFTTASTFNASDYQAPFRAVYRYQDMAVATDIQISGEITLSKVLTHDFKAGETLISNAISMGTMQARVSNLFTQEIWGNKFLDYREGEDSIFKYDTSVAPIEVTNESSIQERWVIVFTNSTNFELIGENIGKVASGTTMEDFMPLNPITKKPYFVMKSEGFSDGAVQGNILRFNTSGANYPVWIVRTVLQSDSNTIQHKYSLEFKGNKDRVLL